MHLASVEHLNGLLARLSEDGIGVQSRTPLADQVLGGRDGIASGPLRKADDAYIDLKHLILTLQLRPGQPLDERKLMEERGHGRTPLREAIQRLTHDGLVVTVPRRGNWVTDLSYQDLAEMMEARALLEPTLAEQAALRITSVEVARLKEIESNIADAKVTRDVSSHLYLDFLFHNTVARAARNRYLARAAEETNLAMLRYWFIRIVITAVEADPRWLRTSRHQPIVAALASADPAAARAAMADHVSGFQRAMHDLFADTLGVERIAHVDGRSTFD